MTNIMVYEKSAIGHNEFINEKRTLHFKERQVLLLINGIRKIEDLEQFFKKELLLETIQKLESNGYIQRSQGILAEKEPSITTQSFFNTDSATTPIDPAKITAIKTILIEAADDYLGLMGRGIKVRIEACSNEVDLRSCISSWHMAMRESKLGRESTSFLMEQIHQTLENKMLDSSQNTH
jgi:hypothetical protein